MRDRVTIGWYISTLFVFVIYLSASCSQYSSRPVAVGAHNFTALYNAYFLANQDLTEAEYDIRKSFKDDYNQMVPILIPMDSLLAMPVRPKLESAIKKASIVIEKHQNSKWVDNSYIVLGKSRLLLGEWGDGLEALRYVFANGKDEDDKNAALVVLMKAYISRKDYSNALGVAEYLSQQPLTKDNQRDFYLTKAFLHQQNGEYLTSVAILEEAFPLLNKSIETGRIHFAAAQMYDKLGQYGLANKHYDEVGKNHPSYDLGFYSSMNSLQNRVILDPKTDVSSVGFEKMLKDRKNDDLKDRIYYTMGLLAEHRKQLSEAVGYLQQSVATSTGANKTQKAYTYLQLARLHYESLERFDLAKAYYDSAVAILPKEAPEYKLMSDRKRALDSFVTQYNIVSREDSLQKLAKMNPAALDNKIDDIIAAHEKARKEEEKRQMELAARQQNTGGGAGAINSLVNGGFPRWELYDPTLMNQGKIEFKRIWGNRILEDDWRRSKKQMKSVTIASRSGGQADSSASVAASKDLEFKKGSEAWNAKHEELKKDVPVTEEMMAASQKIKEEGLYNLGKIYRFDLSEDEKAIAAFNRILGEFPKTLYKDEIYYLMYLTLPEKDANKASWKDKLMAEFPNSTYARLVNKSASDQGHDQGSQLKEYENAYQLYANGNFEQALKNIESNLPAYKGSTIEDKFALLRVFLIGKIRGKEEYAKSIAEFIKLYPSSTYLPRIKEMQELSSISGGKR